MDHQTLIVIVCAVLLFAVLLVLAVGLAQGGEG